MCICNNLFVYSVYTGRCTHLPDYLYTLVQTKLGFYLLFISIYLYPTWITVQPRQINSPVFVARLEMHVTCFMHSITVKDNHSISSIRDRCWFCIGKFHCLCQFLPTIWILVPIEFFLLGDGVIPYRHPTRQGI